MEPHQQRDLLKRLALTAAHTLDATSLVRSAQAPLVAGGAR